MFLTKTKVGVLALAGTALAMTAACGANNAPSPAPSSGGGNGGGSSVSTGDVTSHQGQGQITDGETPRCGTGDLLPSFGEVRDSGTGQPHIQLVYTNVGNHDCILRGTPGIDLSGPVDPVNGPVYSVPRNDTQDPGYLLKAGEAGIAELTVLADGGPGAWVPTQLITIPPGADTPRKLEWPFEFGVVRQDSATHPGTYVDGFGAK